ncbi:MAG: hypothetical protein PVH61_27860 [Candidatus Aminicenantes bacterium]
MAVSSWQYDIVPGYLDPVLNATIPPPGQPGLHRQCQWFNREKMTRLTVEVFTYWRKPPPGI